MNSNIIYEFYSPKYEDEVIDLWNRCCYFDVIDRWKFRRQLILDDNYDPQMCWVAKDASKIVGFLCCMVRIYPYGKKGMEKGRGWINVMFVDPSFRGYGIGQSLYDLAEKKLKDKGVFEVILGAYSPDYFFAGLDPDHYPESIRFFENNGYKALETHYAMQMNLYGYQIPGNIRNRKSDLEKQGYTFKMFSYADSIDLLKFLETQLSAGWRRASLLSQRNGQAPDSQIVVRNPKGEVCGWCMRARDDNPMRFGPVGIGKEERNHGIGSVLLCMQCYEMAKRGIYQMYFMTTDEDGRRYYERNGLHVFRKWINFRKTL